MWLQVMTHFKQDRWMVLGFVQAKAKEWAPLIMKGRDPSEPICMTKACHLDSVTVIRDDGAICLKKLCGSLRGFSASETARSADVDSR